MGVALSLLRDEGRGYGDGGGGDMNGGEGFGIVTTGEIWKNVLNGAVEEMLGRERAQEVFRGVECVGMGAGELHDAVDDASGVEERVRAATRRLVGCGDDGIEGEGKNPKRRVGVVILGCAGMVGMEAWVREESEEGVRVVDGVKAGVGVLQGLVRGVIEVPEGGKGSGEREGGGG